MNEKYLIKFNYPKIFVNVTLSVLTLSIILLSVNQYLYSTEVHHWGVMVNNAKDFINGAKLYKDIFVTYGFLTIVIHSLAFYLYNNIQSVFIITILFYSITPFLY